jgi:protoporphyrinogen oxidase
MEKKAVIIGAGPAGLTAAYELLTRTDIRPLILEKSGDIGGLSKTVNYKGNRIDIGGHRFFSKSDRVMDWWFKVMPPECSGNGAEPVSYRGASRTIETPASGPSPECEDRVMLIRNRKSRIYFLRKFFAYPMKLNRETLENLGPRRVVKILLSYCRARLSPIKPEQNLEHFLINRFGRELYATFFKSYTEKVWGVPCERISAEWGAQRIKGLSLTAAAIHFWRAAWRPSDLAQKQTETSLIEKFLYPKLGPGQLWEYVAASVQKQGAQVLTGWSVERLHVEGNRVTEVTARHTGGELRHFEADYVFSTMPVKELIAALDTDVPENVRSVADGLVYRDFITVGLLVNRLAIPSQDREGSPSISDNWLYIQEPDVRVGRIQVFNNWSPYMVADPSKVWLGLEYFCWENDDLWTKPDSEMIAFAIAELDKIGIISSAEVCDATVIRMPKTYPAYFGTYDKFDVLREWVDRFENLFLVGRNGMHKYNNQDHSMLTAMTAVDNIVNGVTDKSNIWAVNTEPEYHEKKLKAEPQHT